jgi:hypothetical protein
MDDGRCVIRLTNNDQPNRLLPSSSSHAFHFASDVACALSDNTPSSADLPGLSRCSLRSEVTNDARLISVCSMSSLDPHAMPAITCSRYARVTLLSNFDL